MSLGENVRDAYGDCIVGTLCTIGKKGCVSIPRMNPWSSHVLGARGRKNRSDESHTFGPDCRHAYTKPREKAIQRRPFGRKPASSEPTSELKASRLGNAAEQEIEIRHAPPASVLTPAPISSGSREADPNPPDAAEDQDDDHVDLHRKALWTRS